jgi:Fe-S-cluster-containing dehydrogenase component
VWKHDASKGPPPPLTVQSVSNWKLLCEDLEPTGKPAPVQWLWSELPPAVRELVARGKGGTALAAAEQQQLVAALNHVAETTFPLLEEEFQKLAEKPLRVPLLAFRPKEQIWTDHDWKRLSRLRNRLLLHAVYPDLLGREYADPGPPLVLTYRCRGDFIGEIGMQLKQPRSATCVAYNHPENNPKRQVGAVQLVRIGRALFDELHQASASFRRQIEQTIWERRQHTEKRRREARHAARQRSTQLDAESELLGVALGQRLMVIDLDRCTRCDECVKACVATHDDQPSRSRLFLDGPRFQQQVGGTTRNLMLPMTCRSCLDPVCMIPCPVSSIVRGEQGQILIRDWCIGCGNCAEACPYSAIQMHAWGVLPAGSTGWRYRPAWKLGDGEWFSTGYVEKGWLPLQTPLTWERRFLATLGPPPTKSEDRAVCLRHVFTIADDQPRIKKSTLFRLVLEGDALAKASEIWINGTKLEFKGKHAELEFAPTPGAAPPAKETKGLKLLRSGQNVVAVRIRLPELLDNSQFDLKIVVYDDFTQLHKFAVVCDLCNQAPGELTACVKACPHEATRRFDARNGVLVW